MFSTIPEVSSQGVEDSQVSLLKSGKYEKLASLCECGNSFVDKCWQDVQVRRALDLERI